LVHRSLRDTFELKSITSTDKKLQAPLWEYSLTNGEVLFIDDQAYGTPLKPAVMSHGMMVDWVKVEADLKKHNII
jgi:hypothetical protein